MLRIIICRDLYPCKLPEDDDEFIETHWLSIQQVHKMITRGEFVNINLLAALNQWFHTEQTKGVIKNP